jgi:CBS domain-containing protein
MYEFLEYRVIDVMTCHPLTVHPGTPLAEVEALFEQRDFNSLPVVSRDGILLGLVTKLDFLKAFAFTPHAVVPHYDEIMSQPVESVMTRPSISVRPDMMLTRFLQLMVDTRYHSVPVAIGALLVGIVSRQDVVRAIRRAAAGERPGRRGPGPECACEQTATVYH